jgi:hypothetical protein
VSSVAHGTPTDNPGPDQHSPLDRPTPNHEKKRLKNRIINNNNKKKHVSRRAGHPECQRGEEGQSLTELYINKLTREGRSGGTHPATRSGKACKSSGMRKTPLERGEGTLPT